MTEPTGLYRYRVTPRYAEVDQQGIVFNAWYLVWFDEAMAGYFAHCGTPYPELPSHGCDVRLARTELDWAAPVLYGDDVEVEVGTAALGATSITLAFTVLARGVATCRGRTVYVVVTTEGAKQPIPDFLRSALEPAGGPPPAAE